MMAAIQYAASSRTYTIHSGADTGEIQKLIEKAENGTTFFFAAGTHRLTEMLAVRRDDIAIKGAGEDRTKIIIDGKPSDGILIKGGGADGWESKLSADVHQDDKVIYLKNTAGLKAGDILHVYEANSKEFLNSGPYDNIKTMQSTKENPLRESLVEIHSIIGNKVVLNHAVAYDMAGGHAVAERMDMLRNIKVSDFTLTYDLGSPDPNDFSNTLDRYRDFSALQIENTKNLSVSNVAIKNAASNALEIRDSLQANVDHYTADGAHNKGGDGNGYGLHIAGGYYGSFTNLELIDMRHSLVFSSWNAEAYNRVHIAFTNRDINYHGSPDHSNFVLIDKAVYESAGETWRLISPGSVMHPYTDISQNTNLFRYAVGDNKDENIFGDHRSSYLNGSAGDDRLYGGGGNDVLIGDSGNDKLFYAGGVALLQGGGGRDSLIVEVKGSPVLIGEDGNDVLRFHGDFLNGGVTVNGGEGFDEIRLDESASLSRADFSHVSSVEKIRFMESDNILQLDHNIFADALYLRSGGQRISVALDTSDVSSDQTVYAGMHVDVHLADRNGQRIALSADADGAVWGGKYSDRISGGRGSDVLYGNDGDDILYGNNGNDRISGGRGDDHLYGGRGHDVFIYENILEGGDVISDFGKNDKVDISALLEENGLGKLTSDQALQKGYIEVRESGGDLQIALDLHHSAAHAGSTIATLDDMTMKQFSAALLIV